MSTDPLSLIKAKLETMRRKHYECEDPWYSCPKSPEGCANDHEGTACTCGADEANSTIDEILSLLDANF